MSWDFDEIREWLRANLSAKRYAHTIGVEETIIRLGQPFGEDINRLRVIALLHDCGKSIPKDEQVSFARHNGIQLSTDDLNCRGVIHARISEYLARVKWAIKDIEILKAIYYHPTGRERMSLVEKLLFSADYLEPNRKIEHIPELTRLVLEDFERGILEISVAKIKYVIDQRKYLHPDSLRMYNYQVQLLLERKESLEL